ncbi:MAG TPA: hypothetical protein VGA51_20445 [Casimicrobiaceae bacterium]
MPTSFYPKTDAHARAQYVIAGTLYLMSCFVQHRLPLYAERIAKNLQLLGGDRSLTAEMRTLCERLANRWDRICADAARQVVVAGPPADVRALH